MVKLRLTRMGSKKNPHYRIVAANSTSPRDGRHIEVLGNYNPQTEPSTINIDKDKAIKWLARGARASVPVKKLLKIAGISEDFTKNKQKYLQEV